MKFIFSILIGIFLVLLLAPFSLVKAQEVFYKATVEEIVNEGNQTIEGVTYPFQTLKIKFLENELNGKELTIDYGKTYTIDKSQLVHNGDTVVIVKTTDVDNKPIYQISEPYRLDKLIPFIIIFFVAIILLSGLQGIGSIVGMIISLVVIIKYIIPQILAQQDPLLISITGCLIIMVTTIYLAHGFSRKTTIALVATFITLVLTGIIAIVVSNLTSLTGLGSDDAISLKLGPTANINFKGLMLGGILIGTLGVLDDVTTGLAASIFELHKVNPKLGFMNLLSSGLRIGREHVASLVNTLVLAYAGASLPIFILIALNPNNYPLWSILNSEIIIEEVVRTLAGSMGLILAVPLTALLTSFYISKSKS